MNLRIEIDCDNAAFADDPGEVPRILRLFADRIDANGLENVLQEPRLNSARDINGNTVAYVEDTDLHDG